ncbi:MAG: hypothetical protein ACXWM7_02150 [Parachlamydiaceae bacterium]
MNLTPILYRKQGEDENVCDQIGRFTKLATNQAQSHSWFDQAREIIPQNGLTAIPKLIYDAVILTDRISKLEEEINFILDLKGAIKSDEKHISKEAGVAAFFNAINLKKTHLKWKKCMPDGKPIWPLPHLYTHQQSIEVKKYSKTPTGDDVYWGEAG